MHTSITNDHSTMHTTIDNDTLGGSVNAPHTCTHQSPLYIYIYMYTSPTPGTIIHHQRSSQLSPQTHHHRHLIITHITHTKKISLTIINTRRRSSPTIITHQKN